MSQWGCRKWGLHRSGTLSQLHFHLVSLEIQFPANDFFEFHSSPLRCSCMTHFCLKKHSLLLCIATAHNVHAYSWTEVWSFQATRLDRQGHCRGKWSFVFKLPWWSRTTAGTGYFQLVHNNVCNLCDCVKYASMARHRKRIFTMTQPPWETVHLYPGVQVIPIPLWVYISLKKKLILLTLRLIHPDHKVIFTGVSTWIPLGFCWLLTSGANTANINS